MPGIPIPIVNYVRLIKNRESPYYDIGEFLVTDMQTRSMMTANGAEIVYTVNPRIVKHEIEKKVGSEKLTTVNVCRTILALLYGARLNRKDYFVTTTSGGRKNYHIRVNTRTLNLLSAMF